MSKVVFFLFLLIPLFSNNKFLGYRIWETAEPQIKILYNKNQKEIVDVEVSIRCRGASWFQISNFKDFRGAKWKKIVKQVKWRLDKRENVASVWVIFKKKDLKEKAFYISKPISYALDRKNLHKKIQAYENGYMDWTHGKIVISSMGTNTENKNRYGIDVSQELAEHNLYRYSYDILKNISINYFYRIKDYLKLHPVLYEKVNAYLNNIKLKEINYSVVML